MPYEEQRLRVHRTARWGRIGEPSARTRDVWFALHGYAQLASAFAASTRWPESPERVFVFPEALQRFYASDPTRPHTNRTARVVASWMTREARGDDIADNHDYLDALWETVRASAPEAALHVLGFSQGGATAARWSAARAARGTPPARLVLWGSMLPDDLDLAVDAPLRTVPLTLVFGTRDRWAPAARIDAERARLADAGLAADIRQFTGGHRLDNDLLATIVDESTVRTRP